ncbi:rhomboid family intramembrane serine protease [uncultured Robinsoniella sp.]|uniref:rhomboid family intramembrane serine protease n=1 Tax=uncultured Robinsoniella sp. TaxID=904190 RepID=UPI00374F09E1
MNIIKKIKYNSPVILTFTIISFAALILNYVTGGWTNRTFFSVYRSSMASPFYYIRLIGHVFGHGGFEHFSGNMITLLLIGPLLEEKYGSLNIGILMIATAVITGIVNILFFPGTALLGASGIVFALIMLTSLSSMRGEGIPLTFLIVAVFYFGGQLYEGLFVKNNIANLTHILGGILGCGFGFIFKPKISYQK